MDGVSTAQHKPVVVRPSDRARWATLHDHLAKLNPRIGFEHMMLLEEVHYTRDPAGGGLKAATWLFKVRGSELSFATADGVVAFLLKKLQDPAVAAGARAEAAAFAARYGPALGSGGGSGAAGGGSTGNRSVQPVQRTSSGTFHQPPAKKQCVPSAAGAAAGAPAVSAQQCAARGTAGRQQGGLHRQSSLVHRRSSDTGSAAATLLRRTVSDAAAAVAARPEQQQPGRVQKRSLDSAPTSSQGAGAALTSQHSVDLMATGALQNCFPRLKKQRSLGNSSNSQGSRPSSAVSGWQASAADSEQQSVGPPRPSLVYNARRPGELDLMTALSVTGSEVMSWLAATGAEDIPATGQELVAYMMDGDDPVVSLQGLSSASVRELRDVLGGEFNPIVLGYHNTAREAEDNGAPQQQQQRRRRQQQQGGEQESTSQSVSASAVKGAAAGPGLRVAVPAAADSNGVPGSTGSDTTGGGVGTLAGCPVSVPVAVKSLHAAKPALGRTLSTPPLRTGSITDSCKQAAAAAMHPPAAAASACKPIEHPSRLGCISKPDPGRAADEVEADAVGTGEVHVASPRSGDSCDSDSPARAAAAAGGPGRMPLQDPTVQNFLRPAGAFIQLQRRDPRQKLHAASVAAAAAAGATSAVAVGMIVGGMAAAGAGSSKGAAATADGAAAAEAAARKSSTAHAGPQAAAAGDLDATAPSSSAPAAAGASAAAAAAAAAAGGAGAAAAAGTMDASQLARIQAENAELRQKVEKAREERDAAILLCRQYHEQMLQNSHVFGLLSFVFDDKPADGAQAAAAAAQDRGLQE